MKTHALGHRSLLSALLVLPLLVAAQGGCGGNDIPIGGDTGAGGGGASGAGGNGGDDGTCDVSDCGPPLGMPNYQCPDGSTAGPTGECLQTLDGCGWEVIECPPGDECDLADCGPPPGMPTVICDDGSVGGPTGKCLSLDGTCAWEIRECPPPSGYQWFSTCGDPACMIPDPDDPNTPNCTDQTVGDPCTTPDAFCEPPGDTCGAMVVCAATDPKGDQCPISRARHKDTISYLDDRQLERVREEFLSMKMARWHYTSEPAATREHLGFIIDDQPSSPAVMGNGERVDLYGYTSMAAATIQVQQKQIDALERELRALREAVESGCRK
jgi:hypothetical protein